MAAIRATANAVMVARSIFHPRLLSPSSFRPIWPVTGYKRLCLRAPAGFYAVRCSSTKSGAGEKKPPARLAEVQRLLHEAEERYKASGVRCSSLFIYGLVDILQLLYPCADHVTVSYARTVNTKVDMRFNVKNAHWLSERVREKIMQMNRINRDGELVISSTKTRTQKSAAGEQKQLDKKKALSQKKAQRRSRDSWD